MLFVNAVLSLQMADSGIGEIYAGYKKVAR